MYLVQKLRLESFKASLIEEVLIDMTEGSTWLYKAKIFAAMFCGVFCD